LDPASPVAPWHSTPIGGGDWRPGRRPSRLAVVCWRALNHRPSGKLCGDWTGDSGEHRRAYALAGTPCSANGYSVRVLYEEPVPRQAAQAPASGRSDPRLFEAQQGLIARHQLDFLGVEPGPCMPASGARNLGLSLRERAARPSPPGARFAKWAAVLEH